MELHDLHDEPFDQLISETLRERMGPPPSREIWGRIEQEIARPRRRTLLSRLTSLFHLPVIQSALIVAMLLMVVVQPAFYWMNKDYPVVPATVPYAPKERPLPEAELRVLASNGSHGSIEVLPSLSRSIPAEAE